MRTGINDHNSLCEARDLKEERDAEAYEDMCYQVDQEMEHEYNSHGMSEFGFTYKTDSKLVHEEATRRLKALADE